MCQVQAADSALDINTGSQTDGIKQVERLDVSMNWKSKNNSRAN
ncbi:hypothetical protein [Paenibacillus ferrarius]